MELALLDHALAVVVEAFAGVADGLALVPDLAQAGQVRAVGAVDELGVGARLQHEIEVGAPALVVLAAQERAGLQVGKRLVPTVSAKLLDASFELLLPRWGELGCLW